jgi:hypothetical protein
MWRATALTGAGGQRRRRKDAEADKMHYSPIVSLEGRQARDRLSRAMVDALRQAHPEVFAEDGTL